jgi:hypothetical protein
MADSAAASAVTLLPPPEGDSATGDGPWQPSILHAVVQDGGCLRCALRMAGVRRQAAFQVRRACAATWIDRLRDRSRNRPIEVDSVSHPSTYLQVPLPALHAALAAQGLATPQQQEQEPPAAAAAVAAAAAAACCPVCIGILQDVDGVGHAAIAEVVAAVEGRGYELLEGERRLAFALGLSLPYCEAIRTRACWYVLACVCGCRAVLAM